MVIICNNCKEEVRDGVWFGTTANVYCTKCAANNDIWELDKGEN